MVDWLIALVALCSHVLTTSGPWACEIIFKQWIVWTVCQRQRAVSKVLFGIHDIRILREPIVDIPRQVAILEISRVSSTADKEEEEMCRRVSQGN